MIIRNKETGAILILGSNFYQPLFTIVNLKSTTRHNHAFKNNHCRIIQKNNTDFKIILQFYGGCFRYET